MRYMKEILKKNRHWVIVYLSGSAITSVRRCFIVYGLLFESL